MIPISCANCWYNALQTESIGPAVGYCTRHKTLLLAAEHTTCGLQTRKDLVYSDAIGEQRDHQDRFSTGRVSTLPSGGVVNGEVSDDRRDFERVAQETVGEIVIAYGQLGSTIESLARLRQVSDSRAELAMLTLSRGYVRNCVERGGSWTAGVHLFWWTRERLERKVELGYRDLRHPSSPLDRQMQIAEWSLVMLRLFFISDIGHHAENHPLAELRDLPDEAALDVDALDPEQLIRWIRRKVIPRIDELFPPEEYTQLARELHRETIAS